VSAISLFVEDLLAAKSFYQDVFGVDVVFEDDSSECVKFDHLFVNLLLVSAAQEQVEPAAVASRDGGSRFQLSAAARLVGEGGASPTGRAAG
jgi:catechol 2,3-dioxygenase-like lactoylglutathione lyase family enzyme